jgi:hypothetical protein
VCPENSRIEICGFPYLAHRARSNTEHPASIAGMELNGEGRRRSAGSGAAKYACCDSIRNQLPVDIGDGKGEAGAGGEIRRNGNRGDGAKALTIRARWLAQRRRCVRSCIRHGTHDAGMSTMSAAADGQQLLRCGEREHRRRRQQCPENAQQHKCCNPPHAMSLQQPHKFGTVLDGWPSIARKANQAGRPDLTWGLIKLDGCPRFAYLPRLAVGAYLGRKRWAEPFERFAVNIGRNPSVSTPNARPTPHSPFAV